MFIVAARFPLCRESIFLVITSPGKYSHWILTEQRRPTSRTSPRNCFLPARAVLICIVCHPLAKTLMVSFTFAILEAEPSTRSFRDTTVSLRFDCEFKNGGQRVKRIRQRKLRGLAIGCAAGLAFVLELHAQTIPALDAVRVATGLSTAVFVTAPPGDYNRIFVVRQSGQINILYLETGVIKTFLDLSTGFNLRSGGEQGLLGMAFDPDYNNVGAPGQGKFYLNFTVNGGTWGEGTTHISQFQVNPANADQALTTEHLLTMPRPSPSPAIPLTFDPPQSNHNGGWIGFSPRENDDHNLYIATGDGGNGYDQDPSPAP